jgi:exosortase/archaeosortase family protein
MKRRHHRSKPAVRLNKPGRRSGDHGNAAAQAAHWNSWLGEKAPVLWFCGKFFALLVLFYFLTQLPVCQRALDATTLCYAHLASTILNGLGEATRCAGATIGSSKFSMTVLPACSAIEFPLFFTALAIGFPSRLAPKILGVLAATGFFFVLNLLRITSLFLIGVHLPQIFTMAHERLWGIILISAIVALSLFWINWAAPPQPHDAAA